MKRNRMIEKGEQFFADGLSLYVNRVNERFDLPEHEHDFVEICYVWEGSGFHYVGDERIHVTRGDLFFLPIGVPHIFRPSSPSPKEPLIIGNCIFDETMFRTLASDMPRRMGLYRMRHLSADTAEWFRLQEQREEFRLLFSALLDEFQRKRPGYQTMLCGLLLQLLMTMERMRVLELETTDRLGARKAEVADAIVRHIRENLHGKLTLAEVGSRIGVGGRQLQRLIALHFGRSFSELLQSERIDRSCELLADPSLTVADVAARSGIRDLKRFHRLFKLKTGTTPNRYRLKTSLAAASEDAPSAFGTNRPST